MKKELEEKEVWSPTSRDATELRQELKQFTAQRVNGKFQGRFDLYLEKMGIIAFDQWGQFIIRNPIDYLRLQKINDLMCWQDEKDQEAFFESYPEERANFAEKLKNLIAKTREALGESNNKPILFRSKLNEYKAKYGSEYSTEGFQVIEDV